MLLPPSRSPQAELIERNLKNAFMASASAQKQCSGSQYFFSDIPHPFFNCVIELKSLDRDLEKTIKLIWEEYQKHNKPHCWWISERSEPQNASKHLLALGFQKGPLFRGMHATLNDIDLKLESCSNIRIEPITDPDTLDAWVEPLAESFEFSPEVAAAFSKCYKNLFTINNRFINYTAFYDDQLAGVSTLFLDKDSAGLYNGAVFPKFRNKGVLTHLGKTMLREARDQDLKDVVVQVSDASYNISLKAGFKEYINFQAYLSPY